MMFYELDDIEKEALLNVVVDRARADLNDGKPLTEMRAETPGYMDYPQPKLRVVKTMGNFYRVEVHGPDDLQDNKICAVMDIGRGPTKQDALEQAREWFASLEDDTGEA